MEVRVALEMDIHDAASRFHELLDRVRSGDEITIEDGGTPVARLVPVKPAGGRKLGVFRGRVRESEDFNAPLPDDVLEEFEK